MELYNCKTTCKGWQQMHSSATISVCMFVLIYFMIILFIQLTIPTILRISTMKQMFIEKKTPQTNLVSFLQKKNILGEKKDFV